MIILFNHGVTPGYHGVTLFYSVDLRETSVKLRA